MPPNKLPLFIALLQIIVCCRVQHTSAAGTTTKIEEEEDEIGYIQSLIVETQTVASVDSSFQHIEVHNSDHYGKVFVLDDCLQLTERDAPHYNEMMAHVPMMEYLARRTNDTDLHEPMRVLVVGGGDGYVTSELLKYPHIASIDHVELDEEVINVSKAHFKWADAWNDERVNLVIGDGAEFVKDQAEKGRSYHVIVQDASDPFWEDENGEVTTLPSSVLYDNSHFESLYKLLQPEEGVLMIQAETYNIPSNLESIRKWRDVLEDIGFEAPRYGTIAIPTYPTGQIGFFSAHAQNGKDEKKVFQSHDACDEGSGNSVTHDEIDKSPKINWNRILAQFNELSGKTLYYHPRIHRSSFDLPLWVEETIYGKVADL